MADEDTALERLNDLAKVTWLIGGCSHTGISAEVIDGGLSKVLQPRNQDGT